MFVISEIILSILWHLIMNYQNNPSFTLYYYHSTALFFFHEHESIPVNMIKKIKRLKVQGSNPGRARGIL